MALAATFCYIWQNANAKYEIIESFVFTNNLGRQKLFIKIDPSRMKKKKKDLACLLFSFGLTEYTLYTLVLVFTCNGVSLEHCSEDKDEG